MTTDTLVRGLKQQAAPSPAPAESINYRLVIHTDGDMSGASAAVESAAANTAKAIEELNAIVARERSKFQATFAHSFEDKDEIERHTNAAVEKFTREQINARADKLREQVIVARQWAARAEATLKVSASPAAMLTAQYGFDASSEFANLVQRFSALGFAGFQSAYAACLGKKDARAGAALVEVLNASKRRREMAHAAGITINGIAEALIGDQHKRRVATLRDIIDKAKFLEDAFAAQMSYAVGTKSNADLTGRAKIEHGLRQAEITRLRGKS